jgi:predicted N-acyltransferase
VAGLARYAFGDLRCLHVELMDRRLTVSDCEGLGFTHRDFPGFEIDLTQSDDALLSSMTKDRRRCLRRARDNGLVVEEAHDVEFADDYYDQLTEVFGRQKLVPTYSRERLRTLIRCVHPSGTLLLLRAREPGGRPIATGVFPAMNDTMYFWGGASWRASRHLHPNELIQWHAMTYWRSRGIRRYDMGGGGDYKRQYGGREIHVPFFRKSRYPVIACLRTAAQRAARLSQRLGGVGGHPGAMRVCS